MNHSSDEEKTAGAQSAETGNVALKTAHTPTPWRVESDTFLIWGECSEQRNGLPVVESHTHSRNWGRPISTNEHAANVAYIVQCVNAHEALVKALRELIDSLEHGEEVSLSYARAALKLAGEQP